MIIIKSIELKDNFTNIPVIIVRRLPFCELPKCLAKNVFEYKSRRKENLGIRLLRVGAAALVLASGKSCNDLIPRLLFLLSMQYNIIKKKLMILSYHKSLHISFLFLDDIISYNITQTVMILNKMNKWQWYVVG